jgi:hypothetical protein
VVVDYGNPKSRCRPLIAFFDFSDVFEDLYFHYHIAQSEFATRWSDTGNHAYIS